MRIGNMDGATVLNHDGTDYHADENGMFDLPHDLGEQLVSFPHWKLEHEIIDARAAAKATADAKPEAFAARLDALEQSVADLPGQLLEAFKDWWTSQVAVLDVTVESAPAVEAKPKPRARTSA